MAHSVHRHTQCRRKRCARHQGPKTAPWVDCLREYATIKPDNLAHQQQLNNLRLRSNLPHSPKRTLRLCCLLPINGGLWTSATCRHTGEGRRSVVASPETARSLITYIQATRSAPSRAPHLKIAHDDHSPPLHLLEGIVRHEPAGDVAWRLFPDVNLLAVQPVFPAGQDPRTKTRVRRGGQHKTQNKPGGTKTHTNIKRKKIPRLAPKPNKRYVGVWSDLKPPRSH